eukprot:6349970-Amphidinium_carterae.1
MCLFLAQECAMEGEQYGGCSILLQPVPLGPIEQRRNDCATQETEWKEARKELNAGWENEGKEGRKEGRKDGRKGLCRTCGSQCFVEGRKE